MAAKLKVYTAPIGFHDVYVAAASKAAALRAWGSDHDLFARGLASLVTDPALAAPALAEPGKVIRRLRGTTDEQIAALPPDPAPADRGERPRRGSARPAKARPRPDRAPLGAAERALSDAAARHDREEAEIAGRIAAIEREQRAMRRAHARESGALEQARAEAASAYDRALADWRAA